MTTCFLMPCRVTCSRSYANFYRASKKEGLLGLIFQLASGLEVDPATFLPEAGTHAGAVPGRREPPPASYGSNATAEKLMHSYTYELFGDSFMSMATVVVGGREQVFCNKPWSRCFFSQEECRQLLEGGNRWPTELFGR